MRPDPKTSPTLSLSPEAFAALGARILYAVHRADGERLAILGDRDAAMAVAVAHELAPVSVH